MNIEEANGKSIYLDDIENLTYQAEGSSVDIILYDEINDETIMEEIYYPDSSGEVHLNYGKVVRNMLRPVFPENAGDVIGPFVFQTFVDLMVAISDNDTVKAYFVEVLNSSKLAMKINTTIDFLSVPSDAGIILNIPPLGENVEVFVESSGLLRSIQIPPVRPRVGFYSICLNVDDLPIPGNASFRFVMRFDNGEEMRSCVYKPCNGSFQEFVFWGELGGYVSFSMSGALEFAPEFKVSNGAVASGYRPVSSECDNVFRQNTGGLTRKAMMALSKLMTSKFIYHKVDGEWKRIVIEEPSAGWSTAESLCYGHFSFRYAEK